MGLGPSRLTYEFPPPPPLTPTAADLDLSLEGPALQDRMIDPEGYKYCRGLAIKEGLIGAGVAMIGTAAALFLVKRKASTYNFENIKDIMTFCTMHALISLHNGVDTHKMLLDHSLTLFVPFSSFLASWTTVQSLLNYSPGVLFVVSSTYEEFK